MRKWEYGWEIGRGVHAGWWGGDGVGRLGKGRVLGMGWGCTGWGLVLWSCTWDGLVVGGNRSRERRVG